MPFFSMTSSTMMNFDWLSVKTCSILSEGYSESTGMNAAPDFNIPNIDAMTLLSLFKMNITLSSGPTPFLIRLWAILLAFSFNSVYVNSPSVAYKITLSGWSSTWFSNILFNLSSGISSYAKSSTPQSSFSMIEMSFINVLSSNVWNLFKTIAMESRNVLISVGEYNWSLYSQKILYWLSTSTTLMLILNFNPSYSIDCLSTFIPPISMSSMILPWYAYNISGVMSYWFEISVNG